MLLEVRDDLQQLTVATLSRKMDFLNNGQMALIKRDMFRLRMFVEDCCADAVVPNTEPSATPTPSPHKRGPLLKQVRNRASKAARETQSCANS
jgi:hypothetical protein